jgi:hypothetical protein
MSRNLDDVICLLASIPDGQPDRNPKTRTQEPKTRDTDVDAESGSSDDDLDDIEDLTVLGTNPKSEEHLAELKNPFLDRLAETLARFKSDPQDRRSKDAKNVFATMMICHEKEERVEIFCTKNEGLDDEDRKFLNKWKVHMEKIAREGAAHI